MSESQGLDLSSQFIPKLSVGLVNHNCATDSLKLLNRLSKDFRSHQVDLIVVDTCSKAPDRARLEEGLKRLKESGIELQLIFLKRNHLGEARQQIVAHARGDWLLMLDPDVVLPENWIAKALAKVEVGHTLNPRLAGISGPAEIPQDMGVWAETLHEVLPFFWMNLGSPQTVPEALQFVDHLPCSAAVFSVAALKDVGGFSLQFAKSGEDLDVGLRLTQKGYDLLHMEELRFEHRTRIQSLTKWTKRAWSLGWGRSQVLTLHPWQFLKASHAFPLLFAVMTGVGVAIPQFGGLMLGCYGLFLAVSYRKLRRPARAILLTVMTHFAYAAGQLLGFFQWAPFAKPEAKVQPQKESFELHRDVFAHGQVLSKIHLCEKLENLERPFRNIYVLAGWAGLLPLMIRSRAKLKFEKIILVDRDPQVCEMARVVNNALECEKRFEARCLDIQNLKTSEMTAEDLIINTSLEHFKDATWWNQLPEGVTCALQASDLVHPEHIGAVKDLEHLKTDILKLPMFYPSDFEDTLTMTYPNQSFQRFTWIGMKPSDTQPANVDQTHSL